VGLKIFYSAGHRVEGTFGIEIQMKEVVKSESHFTKLFVRVIQVLQNKLVCLTLVNISNLVQSVRPMLGPDRV